ncbi:platelet-derived growth factor D-like isoform X1 [Labeo rohita]|uniref:Platelet-derived growth factor D-like isoform X1 n=1 Tax=Labeo rohita TaxID=84645 RepID=A0A498NGZ4_LABRO|nr:platelet-derived growth factor D-like isoform X1 [Labeo rohita]
MVKGGGHVQSPRFPSSYPRNLLLSWKLLSPPHTRILLEFDAQFGLEEAENGVCRYDYVEVEDISETSTIIWGRWCGQRAPSRITSKTNLIKITFKSDDYFVAKPGFKICYSLLDSSPLASLTNWEAVTMMSVLKFSPGPGFYKTKTRAHWVLEEIHLQHHERCDCVCQSRPPR